MYVQKHFLEDDPNTLHATMRTIGAATLVSQGPDGLIASHVPLEIIAHPHRGAWYVAIWSAPIPTPQCWLMVVRCC